jgi:hypothetical protein
LFVKLVAAVKPNQSMKPVIAPEAGDTPLGMLPPMKLTMIAMDMAWTNDATRVPPHISAMLSPPGVSFSVLPMAFHQMGKKVLGPNQILPVIMLTTTQATTANQLIEPKSILASVDKVDRHAPIFHKL